MPFIFDFISSRVRERLKNKKGQRINKKKVGEEVV